MSRTAVSLQQIKGSDMQRIIFGVLSGVCATMVMTAAMRQLYLQLDEDKRYPLHPSEITNEVIGNQGRKKHQTLTVLAHFAFGGLTGALYPVFDRKLNGLQYGSIIWGLSYLGWVPAARILQPATQHPLERNLLMLTVHLIWGAALSSSLRELDKSAASIFTTGPIRDAGGKYPATNR
ncbi:putative membrane protein YagU involved in acid resistance [Phyllobacterium ifriqiyense]|uniref:Membrane protein YagU involved in acid resistance n=1 Tax=Phyllobacterium ifriqiyense TaxID=314238 RepID=A0ABU0S3M2_9HYPH|nr:hypothetical protein [Phyllobacterium ifriqiyense]MDQ0995216.1 putative membrane protein YagU involved in acid resistance [Phyllobacterium ifriqiyense]